MKKKRKTKTNGGAPRTINSTTLRSTEERSCFSLKQRKQSENQKGRETRKEPRISHYTWGKTHFLSARPDLSSGAGIVLATIGGEKKNRPKVKERGKKPGPSN